LYINKYIIVLFSGNADIFQRFTAILKANACLLDEERDREKEREKEGKRVSE